MPAGSGWVQEHRTERAVDHSDLPLVIHLVLDEQIGVEGIPAAFDPRGSVRALLKRVFLDQDFELFGRAFTQYYATEHSLSHLVSLSGSAPRNAGLIGARRPQRNVYFETMARRGYRIHVHQSDYFDFCTEQGDFEVDSCLTYTLESVKAIEAAPLRVLDKADVMVGMFARLSLVLT
jgi:hypothetical protein